MGWLAKAHNVSNNIAGKWGFEFIVVGVSRKIVFRKSIPSNEVPFPKIIFLSFESNFLMFFEFSETDNGCPVAGQYCRIVKGKE